MRIEDVKIGMRVKYEEDGEVDYGVVKSVYRPPVSTCEEVWCDWESDGTYKWASPEHISPAEENTPKFKVGDKVVLAEPLSVECSDELRTILSGVLTVSGTHLAQPESDGYICTFSEIGPHSGYSERRLAPYTKPKKTAEEIAPMLWTAYRDVLNDEALAALRQVIEDVDNHEKCNFRDSDDINVSFRWYLTSQDHDFWGGVYDGEYDKKKARVSVANDALKIDLDYSAPDTITPQDIHSSRVSTQDTGSAATRNKYSREIYPDIFVDVYDVLRAFNVTDPCLQHLVKKALAVGQRGHKDVEEDLKDILASAKRALEMHKKWGNE